MWSLDANHLSGVRNRRQYIILVAAKCALTYMPKILQAAKLLGSCQHITWSGSLVFSIVVYLKLILCHLLVDPLSHFEMTGAVALELAIIIKHGSW